MIINLDLVSTCVVTTSQRFANTDGNPNAKEGEALSPCYISYYTIITSNFVHKLQQDVD